MSATSPIFFFLKSNSKQPRNYKYIVNKNNTEKQYLIVNIRKENLRKKDFLKLNN